MKPKLILCLALVLSGGLFGWRQHAPEKFIPADDADNHLRWRNFHRTARFAKRFGQYAGSLCMGEFRARYKLSAGNDSCGYFFRAMREDLFVAQPAWGGTGGNLYLAFQQTRNGYRFGGDIWFGGLQIVSPDNRGRQRLITFSHQSSGSSRVALCYLDRDGFHEIMGRILPSGDEPHAEGKDWLLSRAFDFETGKPKDLSESMLQLIFGDPATIEFSGSIKAGKQFEHPFGDRFIFALEPMQYGWEIRVYENGRKEDLAELTLPLHGPNPMDIEGWHFRNEDNTDSSKAHSDVMSQDDRGFIFSPEVGAIFNAPESTNEITEDDIDRIEAFGQGALKITRLKLSPPQLHGTAKY